MKVLLLTHPIPAAPLLAAIRARAPELELCEYTQGLDDATLASVDTVLGWRMPGDVVGRLPRLSWVCSAAAGVEKLLVPGLAPQVRLSRIVDPEQGEGIAQYVAAVVLRHARELDRYARQQEARDWSRWPKPMARHRVAVLGTGAMGGAIVEWLGRVGFVATGWNRRSSRTLHGLLAENEVVVCALPLTGSTENILDAAAFAAMPQGGYVVNVARGAHVVEADLIEAVRAGHLAGAALDVQRREPMPADDPLWSAPGVSITPHIAAQSSPEVIAGQFVDAARALQRGEALPNEVDRSRGY